MNDASLDYRVFRRKARQASHQALYFLYILRKTHDEETDTALSEYAVFALVQLNALVSVVSAPVGSLDARDRDIVDTWVQKIRDPLQDLDKLTFDKAKDFVDEFEGFLKESSAAEGSIAWWSHWFVTLTKYLYKNLMFSIGCVLLAVVYLFVSPVNTLMPKSQWIALASSLASAFLLLFLWRLEARLLYKVAGTVIMPLLMYWSGPGLETLLPLLGLAVTVFAYILLTRHPKRRLGRVAFRSLRHMALEPERGIQRWQDEPRLKTLILKSMAWCIVPILLPIAYAKGLEQLLSDPGTVLIVFSVLALSATFLLLCYTIDFWDFIDPWPIRLIGVVFGATFVGFSLATTYGQLIAAGLLILIGALSFKYIRHWIRWLSLAFFIAAALVTLFNRTAKNEEWRFDKDDPHWKRVENWPRESTAPIVLMAAAGGGSRSALYTAMMLDSLNKELPTIAKNLQIISSVSGGSLANAAYVARMYRKFIKQPTELDRLELASVVDGDYLFPTLEGALVPGASRGKCIEEYWEENVGLDKLGLSHLAETWNNHEGPLPPFPLPIFNSCSLDGHDVVLSPLDTLEYLPDRHRLPVTGEEEFKGKETWVYDRDGIYDLMHLMETYSPKLSESVRASANFPFGFPLVTANLDSHKTLFLTPRGHDRRRVIQMTDGGVLSNSGMWSLFHLMMKNVDELRKRGVLLIIVESSKMPEYRDNRRGITSLYGTIQDKNPIGQNLVWRMLDRLKIAYQTPKGTRIGVVQIDLIPEEKYNVLTTWALGTAQKDSLEVSFLKSWSAQRERLCAAWNHLANHKSLKIPCAIEEEGFSDKDLMPGTDRPPLN